MVSIRYGDYVATYDDRGWSSSDPGLAEMLNALRRPADTGDGDAHLAVAKNAIALLRAGEIIIEVPAARTLQATV